MKNIILASSSPRRHMLMREAGIPFTVETEDTDETCEGLPEERVRILAERKARAIAKRHTAGIVLGADTLVSLHDEAFGKPADDGEASRMLHALSGNTHQVYTGVCVIDCATGRCLVRSARSDITFRTLTDEEIAAYIATGEPAGKAGAYAIQQKGGALVAGWSGPYDNIVGLPMDVVRALLEEIGC